MINAQALVIGAHRAAEPTGGCAPSSACGTCFRRPADGRPAVLHQPGQLAAVAHIIADAIYERLTGEKGYFDTRVVFVDETGPKDKRVKRLAIMDQDGANVRYLTRRHRPGADAALQPDRRRRSPTCRTAAAQPRVYLLNIETGQREMVGDFPGMTFAPRFSPDGQQVIMSLQQGGNANIFTLDLPLAAHDAADRRCRDRHQPVLFAGRLADRVRVRPRRLAAALRHERRRLEPAPHHLRRRARYATPVWSPRGDLIAFTRRSERQFAIGVMQPDGSGERILTEGFHNEGPTWAPNGRVLMFFRDTPGANGGPQLWTIDLTGYNEYRMPTPAFASDPAWSPLIN